MNSLRVSLQLMHPAWGRGLRRGSATALLLAGAMVGSAVAADEQTPELPAPVVIGAPTKAEKPELAPVNIKGQAPAQSEVAPVVVGAPAPAEKSDIAPVKVGAPVQAEKSDIAPVKVGAPAPASKSELAPVKVGSVAAASQSAMAPLKVGGVAASNQVGLAVVNASSLRVPLLLKSVEAGTAKVEELLRAQSLTLDDLQWAVHHPQLWQQSAPVGAATPSTIAVYDAFLARFGEEVAGAASWQERARSALAAELSRRGDARCVALFEAITAEWVADWERGERRKIEGAVPGLHELAWFYQGQNEKLNAAQTYEKSALYSTSSAWVGSAQIEAARLYKSIGQIEKFEALYAQAEEHSEGWIKGIILYDQAYALIKANDHERARALLQEPVTGFNAAEVRVGLLSLLAASYLKTGEVEPAQRAAQQSLEQYRGLNNPPKNEGLEYQVERAKKVLDWCWRYQAGRSSANSTTINRVNPAGVELPPTGN